VRAAARTGREAARGEPASQPVRAGAVAAGRPARGAPPNGRRSTARGGRSPARATALIVGAVLVVAAAVVVLVTSLGGSSSTKGSASTPATGSAGNASTGRASTHRHATSRSASGAANPADESVAVLNGTETTGLAHRISAQLQQRGYSQATALSGRPPGANQLTVVEYASGHQADAEGVARSLGAAKAQPMEVAVASLAGSAKVVVVVGADKAASGP